MLNKNWLVLVVVLSLSISLFGCSIAVPVHEADAPEVLDNWGFRVGLLEGVSPQVAPTDTGLTSEPDASTLGLLGMRFEAGFLERFQVNIESFGSGSSSGSSFAIKYQWVGDTYFKAKAGNFSQVSTLRFWSGKGTDIDLKYNGGNTLSSHSTIEGSGEDISHIWGYRTADWFGFYGGPKVTFGHVEANYKNVQNGVTLATGERNFWGAGALGGIFLSPHGEHAGFDFVLELEEMNLPKTYQDGRSWYTTLMLSASVPFSFN